MACVCLLLALSLALPLASAAAFDNAEDAKRNRNNTLGNGWRNGLGNHAASFNPYAHNSWQWTFFNSTVSFIGLPGLVSPVDGLRDEGLGFHADGTTRRADGADSASGYKGQWASSYMRNGMGGQSPWLYDDVMGMQRGQDGRLMRMGDEYSGRRDAGRYGSTLFDAGTGSMTQSLMQRGLSAGMGLANTAVEGAILGLMGSDSPYGNGKARLNFNWYIDEKGKSRFGGEGDVLWPLYDSLYTTIYTQVGARSMWGGGDDYGPDRWIGNFGLGQRWFPAAKLGEDGKTIDSGNWMIGYNAFFDYDFTRGHQRGGLGVEAQYDWFKIGSNYYAPLSDWKDSKDFDGDFVQERAAQGWDIRAKGYLPFYREIALTGSFTQWYGYHVGMFGPSKLEKDPRVWSYGVEYTPVPAVTAFVNQRQTERGRADTEFGLRFTYHFGVDAESQFKPSRVAEMRTVHGARHDFVDRENKIILEYRAKNKFHIEFLGTAGVNQFRFRIRNGFDEYVSGQIVTVTAGNGVTLLAAADTAPTSLFARALDAVGDFLVATAHATNLTSKTYTTGSDGVFVMTLDTVTRLPAAVTIQVGETSQSVTLHEAQLSSNLTASPANIRNGGTSTITLTGAPAGATVVWSVVPGGPGGTISGSGATATYTAPATGAGIVTIEAQVDGTPFTCTLTVEALPYTVSFASASYSPAFSGSGAGAKASQAVVITVSQNSNPVAAGVTVSIAATMNDSVNQAIVSARRNQYYGLKANSAGGGTNFPVTSLITDNSGQVTLNLEDIVGERMLALTASATPPGGSAATANATVSFGAGPLVIFRLPDGKVDNKTWSGDSLTSNFPAAAHCGGTVSYSGNQYYSSSKLPRVSDLQAVGSGSSGNNAWAAAGWPNDTLWTGEVGGGGRYVVRVDQIGNISGVSPSYYHPVVCLR